MKNRILLIISVLLLVLWFWQVKPDGKTKVVFCDVGQGDGAIIIKNNFQMMIDAGPKNTKMAECLSRYVPFWDKEIEVFIASHGDADHIGGLENIKKSYKIEREFNNLNLEIGEIIRYGVIDFEILSNSEQSIMGILKYGGKKYLFTGDASVESEYVVQEKIDVLKVGHHGSDTSTGEDLLDRVRPKLAVISVGRNNRYSHPREIVVNRLVDRGIEIKRTDLEGDIIINGF